MVDGRQLASFNEIDENGNEVPFLSYTYDDNGIRTSKTDGETTTYYTNINGNVTSQYQLDENGNIINLVEFIYDSSDDVIGFTYEDETYFYLKNLQNDVLGFVDSNGELIVEYYYDILGEFTGRDYTDDVSLFSVNPFKYRSYIYDEEMDMCYLQSRYYITTFPRFLNADLPEYAQMQKGDTAGLNLFAYCNNDPVNNVDPSGFSTTYTLLELMKVFVTNYLLKGKTITGSTKPKKDQSGLYYIDVKYKKSQHNTNKLRLTFGYKDAWNKSITKAKSSSSSMIEFYSQQLGDAAADCSANGWKDSGREIGIVIVSLGIIIANLIHYGTNINTIIKNYNMIWSKNGIDSKNVVKYCMFRVTKERDYDGWYIMSNDAMRYRRL